MMINGAAPAVVRTGEGGTLSMFSTYQENDAPL